jgi:predicted HTH transcriptional regulator
MSTTEIFESLLVTEKELLQEAVSKAKELMGIEEKTGQMILRVPKESLGQKQLVALYLLGQFFAKQMSRTDSASLSIEDLVSKTGIDNNTLAGRLSELVKAGWARRLGKARYEINQFSLNPILDEILMSRRKSELFQPSNSTFNEDTFTHPETEQRQSFPSISKSKGLTDAILNLLQTDWGKTPREWGEISEALKRNALHYSKGSVTGTLTLLTQSGKLRRIKEGRSYKYVAR